MEKTRVIIDCDTGIDDAIAFVLAAHSEKLDILGVTTVAGNVSLENTTRNTCNVLHYLGRDDIKIAAGAEKPLERPLMKASGVHGTNGLRGWSFDHDYSDNLLKDVKAWDYIASIISSIDEKISIVALGPLTNIAILLDKYPEVKDKIERIIFMGTSYHSGNPSPVATFNVLVDPEAFRKVVFSGVDFVSCPLETVREVIVTDEIKEKASSIDTKGGKFVSSLLSSYGITNIKKEEKIDTDGEEWISQERIDNVAKRGQGLPDPMTMAYAINPSIFSGNWYYCDVECKGELTLGMTLVDINDYYMKKKEERNIFFLEKVDKEKFIDMLFSAMESF